MVTLSTFLPHLSNYTLHGSSTPIERMISAVTADSRAVQPHTLFVAVSGDQFDGHRFLPDAIQRGAVAAIGSRSPDELAQQQVHLSADFPYIQISDSRQALALCSAILHDFPSREMTVIGITGTDGKTTTCSILESILSVATGDAQNQAGRVGMVTTVGARICGEERPTGLHVTTPDAPLVQQFLREMRDAGCKYAIVESTSHGLAQARVAAVDFDIAAVTNITHEHLDYHGSREAYVAAKAKLFEALYDGDAKPMMSRCAVLNADDVGSFDALQQRMADFAIGTSPPVQVRRYGLWHQDAISSKEVLDVSASQITYRADRTNFTLNWWAGAFEMETQLIGDFNVSNILCAATIALSLGVLPEAIQQGVAQLKGVLGRMERIDCGQPFLSLVDFAHSPASLARALHTLRPLVHRDDLDVSGRLIAIFGSAGLRDKEKRRMMGQVSGQLADLTIITAEDPRTEDLSMINREIARGVLEYADESAFVVVPDRGEAIQLAIDLADPRDVVAAFGKGHERSMCFGTTEYPWSDQQAMIDALKKRNSR